jgi:hypothetical protein
MWATVALTAVLGMTPAQSGTLDFKNIRLTHSVLGQERKDSKVLPGDLFVVHFDIEGLKVEKNGRVMYSMGMELIQKVKGKDVSKFKQLPRDLEALNILGGTRLPAFAQTIIGTDAVPGDYTLKVTVRDRVAKIEKVLTRTFEVVQPRFGFVQTALLYNVPLTARDTPIPAPGLAVPGQLLYLNFALVGFELDKKTMEPDVTVEMRVVDEDGKPTVAKPFSGTVKRLPKGFQMIPFDPLALQLNRVGKFKIVLKATDNVNGKKAEQSLDLTVRDTK